MGEWVAEIVLFHHAHGKTAGVVDFADALRRAGHVVHAPDLFDGRVFDRLDEGLQFVDHLGFGNLIERGARAVDALSPEVVYAGFSLGVLPAQKLAQTRPGARGALLYHSCVPVAAFGGAWPDGVPVQVHAMAEDPVFAGDGDIEAARALVEREASAELFLYPGNQHLFADSSLPSYAPDAAGLLLARTLAFLSDAGLARLGSRERR